MTLGTYVEAMASAHRRVVDVQGLIKRYEDVRVHLIHMGQIRAAAAVSARTCVLELQLKRLEVMLVVASYSVRNAFDAACPVLSPVAANIDLAEQVSLEALDL